MLRWFSSRVMRSALVVGAAASFFQGCASQSLSPSVIRTVSVQKRSQMPQQKQIIYATSGQTAAVVTSVVAGGLVGGAIAAAVSSGVTADERVLIRERFLETGADPGLILANEWERQLQAYQFYPVVPAGGDAEFRIEIRQIGLSGSGRRLYPDLTGEAKLVRRDGTVLWQEESDADGKDERVAMRGYSFAEYMADPNLMREAFTKAAEVFSRELLGRFREEYQVAVEDDVDQRRDAEDKDWSKLSAPERKQRERLRDAEEDRRYEEEEMQTRARELREKQELLRAKAERRRLERERRARVR